MQESKTRGRESSEESAAVIQLSGDGGQGKGGAWGHGEKRLDTRSTLDVDPSGLHVEDKGNACMG